jgi:hypothetical protein
LLLSSHDISIYQDVVGKEMSDHKGGESLKVVASTEASVEVGKEVCTPNPALRKNVNTASTNSKKQQNSKKVSTNTKTRLQSAATKSTLGTPHFAQENQAIKRQKLEGGKTRQVIVNVKRSFCFMVLVEIDSYLFNFI